MISGRDAMGVVHPTSHGAVSAFRAQRPSSAQVIAGLPDVLDAVVDAVIATQTNPSARRIADLRTCLAAAERELGRIAAALEVTG